LQLDAAIFAFKFCFPNHNISAVNIQIQTRTNETIQIFCKFFWNGAKSYIENKGANMEGLATVTSTVKQSNSLEYAATTTDITHVTLLRIFKWLSNKLFMPCSL